MIIRRTFLSLVSLLAAFGLSFEARSSELGSDYLLGKWVIDGNDCSDSRSEFVMFRKSGAVESVRAEKLEAAGFWEVSGDIINVHFVASPAFFHDDQEAFTELKAFEGEFYAFRIRVVPFNVDLDKFEAVGLLGEQVKKAVFSRCKD